VADRRVARDAELEVAVLGHRVTRGLRRAGRGRGGGGGNGGEARRDDREDDCAQRHVRIVRLRKGGGQYADRRTLRSVSRLTADGVIAVLDVAERLAWADTLVGFRAGATRAVRELVPC